jgi:hypothetical protein
MPWKPRYAEADARAAITGAGSWRVVLHALGVGYHGKNINTLRRWAKRWGIPIDHLPDRRGRNRKSNYGDADLRVAIANSRSWAEALRRLGYCPSGGNWKTLKKRTAAIGVSTDHFDPYATSRERRRRSRIPLTEILTVGSTFSRTNLKQRLYEEGIKEPRCELCGQDENWCGKRMGLILDHTNGVRDDNRLENLRIVCPNCAATLDTHCGKKNREPLLPLDCLRCGRSFVSDAALLLERVWLAVGPQRAEASRCTQGRAAFASAASTGGGSIRVFGGGSEIRGLRQCDSQVVA